MCQAYASGVTEAWAIIIMEEDYFNLLINYSTFIYELKAAFIDLNL